MTATILEKIVNHINRKHHQFFKNFDNHTPEKPLRDNPLLKITDQMKNAFTVIAEVKKASPSKGIITENFDPVEIAKAYEAGGAGGISVLTEPDFFLGSPEYLKEIKAHTNVPVLKKDFIIHPYQIYEAYKNGADFILLIKAILKPELYETLLLTAKELGLETLAEVHDERELEAILEIAEKNPRSTASLIGINNRDLATFRVNLSTSFTLKKMIPEKFPVIAESGIETVKDAETFFENGFAGILVGESLIKQKDRRKAVKKLLHF